MATFDAPPPLFMGGADDGGGVAGVDPYLDNSAAATSIPADDAEHNRGGVEFSLSDEFDDFLSRNDASIRSVHNMIGESWLDFDNLLEDFDADGGATSPTGSADSGGSGSVGVAAATLDGGGGGGGDDNERLNVPMLTPEKRVNHNSSSGGGN